MTLEESLKIINLSANEMADAIQSMDYDQQREHHVNTAAIHLIFELDTISNFTDKVKKAREILITVL